MQKFRIELARTEYLSKIIEVEAENKQQAIDIAWDHSGKWQCVDAEEFTNTVEAIE